MRDVRAEDPTPMEWHEARAKPVGDGGCEAQLVVLRPEGEPHDRKEVLRVEVPNGIKADGALTDPDRLLEVIQRMRYMRSVPTGRARKELYQMATEADPNGYEVLGGIDEPNVDHVPYLRHVGAGGCCTT